MQDKRASSRLTVPGSGAVTTMLGRTGGTARVAVQIVNWSRHGLLLTFAVGHWRDAPLRIGDSVVSTLSLPSGERDFLLSGKVVHLRSSKRPQWVELGLRFDSSRGTAAEVERFVQALTPRAPSPQRPISEHPTISLDPSSEVQPSLRQEPSDADPPDALVGRRVGPCLVEAFVAEGGFGRVYRAHHLRLEAPVALKLLTHVTADGKELERFKREAKAAAQLTDPHVARVYELGCEGGRAFMVQELVEGESLAQRVARLGPLPVAEVVELGIGIASGLVAIHEAGLVHRDLKPDNVMILPNGRAKIVDFGLVQLAKDQAHLTREGLLLGTPAYLAPEQIKSGRARTEAPADVFTMGCVLFFALTGEVPHIDSSDETFMVFISKRMRGETPDVRGLRADVPELLAQLISCLLAPDPELRGSAYQARTVLLGLRRTSQRRPAPANTPSRRVRTKARRASSGRTRSLSSSGSVTRSHLSSGLARNPSSSGRVTRTTGSRLGRLPTSRRLQVPASSTGPVRVAPSAQAAPLLSSSTRITARARSRGGVALPLGAMVTMMGLLLLAAAVAWASGSARPTVSHRRAEEAAAQRGARRLVLSEDEFSRNLSEMASDPNALRALVLTCDTLPLDDEEAALVWGHLNATLERTTGHTLEEGQTWQAWLDARLQASEELARR